MADTAKSALNDPKMSLRTYQGDAADKNELLQLLKESLAELPQRHAVEENNILAFFKRRGLSPEIFNTIFANKLLCENQTIKMALASHHDTPSNIVATILSQLNVFELLKITLLPGISPERRFAAERSLIQRMPAQPLGNKLTLARRSTAAIVEALLKEGLPQLVEACLENPYLKEGAVHQFLSSGGATAETISMVARNGRWKGRPNIRLAILKNPRTPLIWFTLFLPGLPHATLRDLLSSPRLTFGQKEVVRQALTTGHGAPC